MGDTAGAGGMGISQELSWAGSRGAKRLAAGVFVSKKVPELL